MDDFWWIQPESERLRLFDSDFYAWKVFSGKWPGLDADCRAGASCRMWWVSHLLLYQRSSIENRCNLNDAALIKPNLSKPQAFGPNQQKYFDKPFARRNKEYPLFRFFMRFEAHSYRCFLLFRNAQRLPRLTSPPSFIRISLGVCGRIMGMRITRLAE